MIVLSIIGLSVVVLGCLWAIVKFIGLALEMGFFPALLAPLYLVGVLVREIKNRFGDR